MNTPLLIRCSICLASPQKVMTCFLRFACMLLFVVIPIGVWAQTNSGQIKIDAAIQSLIGPGSYSNLRVQPDGSFGLADIFDESGNPNYDLDLIESLAANDPGNVTLQRNLCSYYYQHRDYTNAAKWAGQAAAKGDVLGATILGMLALEGKGGVPCDESRAVTLFQLAAEQGYTYAMLQLADCHLHGTGVPPDRKAAIGILKLAASQQDEDAMRSLVRIYLDLDQLSGKRNYIAGYWWWRKAMKVELAAENSFIFVQVIEVVAGLITLSVAFFVTRYVRRLVREFRRPSFMDPSSSIKFAVVQDWEEFKQLVKAYRERESTGDRSQPVPVLVNQPQGFGPGLKEGLGESWHDAPKLLEFDRFWKSVCRWALILGLAIVAAGFTSAYHWASHWKLLVACLGGLVLAVLAIHVGREQWLLNRLIQTRRVTT